mgnify:CR=1 FL=1
MRLRDVVSEISYTRQTGAMRERGREVNNSIEVYLTSVVYSPNRVERF